MYTTIKKVSMVLAAGSLLTACNKFDEINVNPTAANVDQVQVEYFINNAIGGAQQDPHVAERAFVLYWETAGHTSMNGTNISNGSYNDGWSSDYYSYISGWLNSANTAIQVADEKIAADKAMPYTNNLKQVARIWRVYLMSELADNFGPIPINAFQGVNPEFSDLKTVYYFLLSELKDAASKIDRTVTNPANLAKLDPAYGYNYASWIKYANSMRLRLAMRLSEVDAGKAKTEFEDAVKGDLIKTSGETFQVAERPGWDSYTGVMTREWNPHYLPATLNTLYTGLGGIKTDDQMPDSVNAYIKPANYIGLKFDQHFPATTNYPMAQYWLDGLPNTIDPRAYKTYIPPGHFSDPNFNYYPSWDNTARTTVRSLTDASGAAQNTINAKLHWNAYPGGDWGAKGSRNQLRLFNGTIPRLSHAFRNNASKRVFFAPWETYFLIAEAAVRGWAVPMSGKAAYEEGIKSSFEYWGTTPFLSSYLASQDYNRAGTSVNWDHTAEPPATYTMQYIDGYTNAPGTATINYPKNDLYKSGTVRNDLLTKIITQKFIAQTPWLPLETWNDQRRLGLPFFENVVVENPIPTMPALNASNYMTSNVKFFPQRLRYPSGLKNSNAKGYEQAVTLLAGPDEVLTPLWWAKKQ